MRVQAAPATPVAVRPASRRYSSIPSVELTRSPPRVATMGDEAGKKQRRKQEERCRVQICEASAPPSSRCAIKNTSFLAKWLQEDVTLARLSAAVYYFVPVILFLTLLSRFPPEWWVCPPPGIHRYCCSTFPVETGLRSLRVGLSGERVQEAIRE